MAKIWGGGKNNLEAKNCLNDLKKCCIICIRLYFDIANVNIEKKKTLEIRKALNGPSFSSKKTSFNAWGKPDVI